MSDPLSLAIVQGVLQALLPVAMAAKEKFEEVGRLLKQEKEFVVKYKNAVDVFSEEAGQVEALFTTIVAKGEPQALTAVLESPDGEDAFQKLSDSLESTETLLNNQKRAADKLLLQLRSSGGGFKDTAFAMIVNRERARGGDLIAVIENAFANLDMRREEIRRRFDHFRNLYEFHGGAIASPARQTELNEDPLPTSFAKSLDAIQYAFNTAPFHISVQSDEKSVELLHHLNTSREQADQHATLMEGVGERWVEDRLIEDSSVLRMGKIQVEVMNSLCKSVERETKALQADFDSIPKGTAPSEKVMADNVERRAQLVELASRIRVAVQRAKGQRFSIAFCGMVKAGKSLFLNALMGRIILPSDELPSTAWPCRLQHTKGQRIPTLEVDTTPFLKGLDQLQYHKFSVLMQAYKPPEDDPFAAILDDDASGASVEGGGSSGDADEAYKRDLYTKWIDLHPTSKVNLREFENKAFKLATKATGEKDVTKLLSQLNDIVRLCHRFKLSFDMEGTSWPALKVEFDSLRNEDIEGEFEFIDLPGIGEAFEDYDFEELIRRVAKEAEAVVPIVSFKEVPKDDWRRLPDIIKNGIGRAPDIVLCTHYDQISKDHLPEQTSNVVKVFWPRSPGVNNRILPCSSRMGLSAHTLLRMSSSSKPPFKDIWDRKGIQYDCAEKILGVGSPEPNFTRIDHDQWISAVRRQLKESGLTSAIERLTTDMVAKARQRLLFLDNEQLRRQLHRMVSEQKRLLLEMRRSEEDYEQAYREFKTAKSKFRKVLDEWTVDETRMHLNSAAKLKKSFEVLQSQGANAGERAVESNSKNILQPSREELTDVGPNILVFKRISDAEQFLSATQKDLISTLKKLRHQFVGAVRGLANQARSERFTTLKKIIQDAIRDDLQPSLKEEIIEELDERGIDVQTLFFSNIKRQAVNTIVKRFTPGTAYDAIADRIAEPFIRSKLDNVTLEDWNNLDALESEERACGLKQLGFMARAPIAVIAAIPWALGSPIWPFLAKSKTYLLDKEKIAKELQSRVAQPFLDALKKDAELTLYSMMKKSSQVAKEAVEGALEKEEQRYESERSQKAEPPAKPAVVASLVTLSNLVASEAAMKKLQEYLKRSL